MSESESSDDASASFTPLQGGSDDPVTLNLNNYDDQTVKQAFNYVANTSGGTFAGTSGLARRMGHLYEGQRDMFQILGYPKQLTIDMMLRKYKRGGIAARIIEKPAKDTWRLEPEVYDTESHEDTSFSVAYRKLCKQSKLVHFLRRADVLTGIGEYGLLFLGVADNTTDLSEPINVDAVNGIDDLRYLTPYGQHQVQDWVLGRDAGLDETNPMYNKPVMYSIDVSDPKDSHSDIQMIHYSRLIHFTEDALESDIRGKPRLRPVYNRLLDYDKVVGGAAEMFWTGADRKYHFNVKDGYADLSPKMLDKLDEDVQKLVHEMQSYIKTAGVDMNVISGEDPDPTGVKEAILSSIAGTIGMPQRILSGSERGDLASTQDKANWFGTVEDRQNNHAEPNMFRSTVDRLIAIGVLPEPREDEYYVVWPSLFELTDKELAEVQKIRAETLQTLSATGDPLMLTDHDGIREYITEGVFPELDEPDDITLPDDRDRDAGDGAGDLPSDMPGSDVDQEGSDTDRDVYAGYSNDELMLFEDSKRASFRSFDKDVIENAFEKREKRRKEAAESDDE